MEFYCPYCRLWINDGVHRQHYHNDLDEPDDCRDWRVRVGGVVYEDDSTFYAINKEDRGNGKEEK
jgi:hypothetical protein